MTTNDTPSMKRALGTATSAASEKVLYAPTTSQMRHKFTFHQLGQLAHLNTIVLNYLQQQKQEESVEDLNDNTEKEDIVADPDDCEKSSSHPPTSENCSDAKATAVAKDSVPMNTNDNQQASKDNSSDTNDNNAETKRDLELERAREILNEYVEALRLSKITSQSQKKNSSPPSSKQHHAAASISHHVDESSKHLTTGNSEGNNPVSPSRRADGGTEGSVQQLRKRALPMALRPSLPIVKKLTLAVVNRERDE